MFLVIQHAELEDQKKYIGLLREAVNEGQANAADLALELDAVKVRELAERYNSTMAVQRLGFLLELTGNEELVTPLKEWLKKQKYHAALLEPAEKTQSKVTGNIWKIIVNTEIETDL